MDAKYTTQPSIDAAPVAKQPIAKRAMTTGMQIDEPSKQEEETMRLRGGCPGRLCFLPILPCRVDICFFPIPCC